MPLLDLSRDGAGPTVVWLHGFTQTRSAARSFRTILAGTATVLTLDLPGHGSSSAIDTDLAETADLVAASIPEERFILAGYSLGGRVALHVALRHHERLRGLVTLGATRGIADAVARQERRARDEALADRVLEVGADTFLAEWLAQPMFAALGPLAEPDARSRDAAGLARSLRRCGTGTQSWLGDDLRSLDLPVLALAGADDAKFSAEALAIAEATGGDAVLVEGAGHAAHLESAEHVAQLVGAFVLRNSPPPRS